MGLKLSTVLIMVGMGLLAVLGNKFFYCFEALSCLKFDLSCCILYCC